jgi:hypothetical protein
MPHEAIGEILVGIAEIGVEAATSSDNKKNGCGCLIATVIILGIIVVGFYYLTTK